MFWLVFWFLVCVQFLLTEFAEWQITIIVLALGLFKSSDSNLDEKDEFVDKDYYDKKNLFKQYKAKSKALELFSRAFCCVKTLPHCTGAFLILQLL